MWLVLVSTLMLLAGGYSLVAGLLKLRNPATFLMVGASDSADSQAEVDLNRQLAEARSAAVGPHRTGLRIEAGAEVALALFTLYATAAVLARDRRGRALSLAVGCLGIVYQLAVLPLYLAVTQAFAARGSTLLARSILRNLGETPTDLTAEQVTLRLHSAIVGGPLVAAVAGILGSLLLIILFGGRRGRVLYGMTKPLDSERRRERRES